MGPRRPSTVLSPVVCGNAPIPSDDMHFSVNIVCEICTSTFAEMDATKSNWI